MGDCMKQYSVRDVVAAVEVGYMGWIWLHLP